MHPTSIKNRLKELQQPVADPNKYVFLEGLWIGPSICYVQTGLLAIPVRPRELEVMAIVSGKAVCDNPLF